jgi:hypothetical protein
MRAGLVTFLLWLLAFGLAAFGLVAWAVILKRCGFL